MSIFFYEASRLYFKKKKGSYLCCCFHLLNALHFHACCSVASNSPGRIHSSARNFIAFHCLFLTRWCYSYHSVADKIYKIAWDVIKYTEHKQFCINCCNSVQASMLSAFFNAYRFKCHPLLSLFLFSVSDKML